MNACMYCCTVLMWLMSSTCEHDWFNLPISIWPMDVHGCAKSLTKSLTRFHHFPLLFPSTPFLFHPPLSRPNSRTFWPRWNTICWLISQAIASHALIFTSRRTESYPLSWEVNWEANWAKGKGHFRALWGKDVSTITFHLITFCQLVANTTVFKLWEKNVAVVVREDGCRNGDNCDFCHFCSPQAVKDCSLGRDLCWWEPLAGSQGHMQIACHILFLAKVQDLGKMKFHLAIHQEIFNDPLVHQHGNGFFTTSRCTSSIPDTQWKSFPLPTVSLTRVYPPTLTIPYYFFGKRG